MLPPRKDICTKAIERLKVDIEYYERELVKDADKLSNLEANPSSNEDDKYIIKNYKIMIEENKEALKYSKHKLKIYENELQEILDEETEKLDQYGEFI